MLERILNTIDLYINSLQKDYPKALTDNLWQAIINLRKYSDSQPRDDHGRWTDGGGGGSASGGGSGKVNYAKPLDMLNYSNIPKSETITDRKSVV